jgi:hypothetical protein
VSNIEDTKPIDVLAGRVWSGTHWHYPNIEKMIERIHTITRDLAAAREELAAANATVEKCKEQLATAQRAGDNLRGYAKLLCDAVPPTEEHRAKFDRLRRAAERWESLRSVEFVVADEAKSPDTQMWAFWFLGHGSSLKAGWVDKFSGPKLFPSRFDAEKGLLHYYGHTKDYEVRPYPSPTTNAAAEAAREGKGNT